MESFDFLADSLLAVASARSAERMRCVIAEEAGRMTGASDARVHPPDENARVHPPDERAGEGWTDIELRGPDGDDLGMLSLAWPDGREPDQGRQGALAAFARTASMLLAALQEAEAARGDLRAHEQALARMAHDARNSLNTLMLRTDLLLRTEAAPPRHREHVEAIRRAALGFNRLMEERIDSRRTAADPARAQRASDTAGVPRPAEPDGAGRRSDPARPRPYAARHVG